MFSGNPPDGAFYAFVKINRPERWAKERRASRGESLSWAMAEHLIKHARIGCVPGRRLRRQQRRLPALLHLPRREELTGALESMKETLSRVATP